MLHALQPLNGHRKQQVYALNLKLKYNLIIKIFLWIQFLFIINCVVLRGSSHKNVEGKCFLTITVLGIYYLIVAPTDALFRVFLLSTAFRTVQRRGRAPSLADAVFLGAFYSHRKLDKLPTSTPGEIAYCFHSINTSFRK